MFKNLKLGAKIGVGFASIIIIALLLGGIATWNMLNVRTESDVLAQEYVPEVKIAAEIQNSVQTMMFQMRGYDFRSDEEYLVAARQSLADLKQHLAAGDKLVAESTVLVAFGKALEEAETELATYEKLLEEAVSQQTAVAAERVKLDVAAGNLLESLG